MTLRRIVRTAAAAGLLVAGCGDEDPLGTITPDIREGADRIWEVAAPQLPSAFDVFSGRRLFLGGGDVGATAGDVFLEGRDGELRLRALSGLVRALEVHPVGIQDLGATAFEAVRRVPTDGYLDPDDADGVAAVEGHVYALQIRRSTFGVNYAKLAIEAVGGDPGGRFIDFRYAAQVQFENPDVVEEE